MEKELVKVKFAEEFWLLSEGEMRKHLEDLVGKVLVFAGTGCGCDSMRLIPKKEVVS